MTRTTLAGDTFVIMIVVFALAGCDQAADRAAIAKAAPPSAAPTGGSRVSQDGLLYGRITTEEGAVYEGRLRWGGDEEALWSNYFNGAKRGNPWVALAPREHLLQERNSVRVFGKEIFGWDNQMNLNRPFMARFGDIARIEPRGRDLQVILKSGTVFHLARYGADDMNDGVRVWDDKGGFVDISEWKIRTIEFFSAPARALPNAELSLMHGTVRTRAGAFTGLIQWNRQACLGADVLEGTNIDGRRSLRFDAIRSIARRSPDSSLVTLLDGSQIVLSGTSRPNSGIYVDDQRYGRVLVSWDAFERVDFSPGGSAAPGYGDFQPGSPLTGEVVTRSGRRLEGRLVFDLDESETTETLDAPWQGVDYMIPFSRITSIVPGASAERDATVTLLSGEVLKLERWGDLSTGNAGLLIFLEGRARPEHVAWADVERIELMELKSGKS